LLAPKPLGTRSIRGFHWGFPEERWLATRDIARLTRTCIGCGPNARVQGKIREVGAAGGWRTEAPEDVRPRPPGVWRGLGAGRNSPLGTRKRVLSRLGEAGREQSVFPVGRDLPAAGRERLRKIEPVAGRVDLRLAWAGREEAAGDVGPRGDPTPPRAVP